MNAQPKFYFSDSESIPWSKTDMPEGVEMKRLGEANGYVMESYRIAPNTILPDHLHNSPEFIFVLEGEVFQNEQLLPSGWSGIAETGTTDKNFRSGENGARTITVYGTDVQFL